MRFNLKQLLAPLAISAVALTAAPAFGATPATDDRVAAACRSANKELRRELVALYGRKTMLKIFPSLRNTTCDAPFFVAWDDDRHTIALVISDLDALLADFRSTAEQISLLHERLQLSLDIPDMTWTRVDYFVHERVDERMMTFVPVPDDLRWRLPSATGAEGDEFVPPTGDEGAA